MNIKEVLGKVVKAEALTDEEKALLAGYDPDKELNSTAAAARKTAEGRLKAKEAELAKLQSEIDALKAEAEEKANANKPELERLQQELAKAKKTLVDKEAAFIKLESEKKQMIRDGKVGKIIANLHFVDGLDPEIPKIGIQRLLAGLKDEELDSEDLVKPLVDKFVASNKAILADTSGSGAGSPPKDNASGTNAQTKTVDKMTPAEREADLKKRGII